MRSVIVFLLVLAAGVLGIYYFDPDTFSAIFGTSFSGALSGLTGGNLSFAQIQNYASNAGFSGDDLNTATAIALAESSGNPNAAGDPTLGGSYGLWQINLAAHPEYTAQALYDPQTNANAAYAIYSAAGGQFTPWTTFNTGAYEAYLQNGSSTQVAANSTGDDFANVDDSSDQDYDS
jgi:hypothetical protein